MIKKPLIILALIFAAAIPATDSGQSLPIIEILDAAPVFLPGGDDGSGRILSIDSNSPAERDSNGNLYVFTSSHHPYRSIGTSIFDLSWPGLPVFISPRADVRGGQWMEATYRDEDGTLYGWYHNEPPNLCGNARQTAPRIGALVSYDEGETWQNFGIVIDAPAGSLYCDTRNYYFAGGNGDFSVVLDQNKEYFYFFISTYHRQVAEQGVAVARMRYEDRNNPNGKVWKWYAGGWNEPGMGGHVTTTFPALIDWHRSNANAYWGAAVHYNIHLESYVMLLNHSIDANWSQEGVYISFNKNLENSAGWSAPQRLPIYQQLGWYPQVIGTGGDETDKVASQTARLFISGRSFWEIVFHRTDNEEPGNSWQIPPRPAPKERPAPIIR
jgi:hypothetical protein